MMCPTAEVLTSLLSETLPAQEVAVLETHVAVCATCRQRLDALCRDGQLASWRHNTTDDQVPTEVLQRLVAGLVPVRSAATTPLPGTVRFQRLRLHAEGGMGMVSVAHDQELNREVALKEIRDGLSDSLELQARFVAEAEITSKLEHPGVVPVYGLGRDAEGRPFYATRLIDGESLAAAVARTIPAGGPETRKLLARMHAVCITVAYAHSRKVVHRDIKPANIMLGDFGETFLMDWGLAKPIAGSATDGAAAAVQLGLAPDRLATLAGTVTGTPQYMSPEQAAGATDSIGPASDIYSLGATLYFVLTGRPPFRAADTDSVLQQVRAGTFPPPRQVAPTVSRAMQAICLKAMALRPQDRYATARALAEDLERYLANEPVTAYSEPWPTRLRRLLTRHRTAAIVAIATVAVAVALLAAWWWTESAETRRADAEQRADNEKQVAREMQGLQQRAAENAELAQHYLYASEMNVAQQAWREGRITPVLKALERWRPAAQRSFEWAYLQRLCRAELLDLDAHALHVDFEASGKHIATQGLARSVKIWNASDGQLAREFADGNAVAWGAPGTVFVAEDIDGIALLRLSDWSTRQRFGAGSRWWDLRVDGAGKLLMACGKDGKVSVWDSTTGNEVFTTTTAARAHAVLAPDGKRLAVAGDRHVALWSLASGQHQETQQCEAVGDFEGAIMHRPAFSPDGRWLAAGFTTGAVAIWSVADGALAHTFRAHRRVFPIAHVYAAFDRDNRLVTAGNDGVIRWWTWQRGVKDAHVARTIQGHTGAVTDLSFSRDGRRLACADESRHVKVWDVRIEHQEYRDLPVGELLTGPAIAPDGRSAVYFERKERRWCRLLLDPNSTSALGTARPFSATAAAFAPDGSRFALGQDTLVAVWDTATNTRLIELPTAAEWLVFGAHNNKLLTTDKEGTLRLWDLDKRAELKAVPGFPEQRMLASPNGKRVAHQAADLAVVVRDTDTLQTIAVLAPPAQNRGEAAEPLAFSTDAEARYLLTRTMRQPLTLWDVHTRKAVHVFREVDFEVTHAAFSPDGQRIALGGVDGAVALFDATRGNHVLTLARLPEYIVRVSFSRDGRRLVAVGGSVLRIFETASAK